MKTSKSLALIPKSPLPSQAATDDQAIALWLHGKSRHSRRAYASDVSRFRQFVNKPLPAATLRDLQAFADSLAGLAPASRNRTLSAVKSLLTACHKIGYAPFNVGAALTLRRPKNTLAERILSRESVIKLFALEPDPRNQAILRFLYETGSRVSELCSLRWRDIEPREAGTAQATIYGKGDRTRVVLFSRKLHRLLADLGNDASQNEPVFPSKSGKPLDQPAVYRILRKAALRAGIRKPVSPHWLRHACASHALDAGAPISLVKSQLGHASLETTSVYAHARPEDGLFRYLGR